MQSLVCSGAVRVRAYYSRAQLLQLFISSTGIQNGEVRIKVQNGKFTIVEAISKMRNNDEEIEMLENFQF